MPYDLHFPGVSPEGQANGATDEAQADNRDLSSPFRAPAHHSDTPYGLLSAACKAASSRCLRHLAEVDNRC